jgi:hypothetical protein
MEKVDTVSKNVSNVKVKGSPIRARVLTIDTGTHRLIHPSASTLQPAPAFFSAFVPFCGQLTFSPPAWGWSDSFGDGARPR